MELINNIEKIRKSKSISINTILVHMGWANRSVLYKKEKNRCKVSITEALMLSQVLKEPITKIFTLKVSKIETKIKEVER